MLDGPTRRGRLRLAVGAPHVPVHLPTGAITLPHDDVLPDVHRAPVGRDEGVATGLPRGGRVGVDLDRLELNPRNRHRQRAFPQLLDRAPTRHRGNARREYFSVFSVKVPYRRRIAMRESFGESRALCFERRFQRRVVSPFLGSASARDADQGEKSNHLWSAQIRPRLRRSIP